MVATCIATARPETRNVSRRRMLSRRFESGHLIGGVLGGSLLGGALVLLSFLLHALLSSKLLLLAFTPILVLLVLRGFGIRWDTLDRVLLLTRKRQVPREWARRFPSRVVGALYGFCLALGFATTADIPMPQALLLIAVGQPSLVLCYALGVTYGVTRTLVPVLVAERGWLPSQTASFVHRTYGASELASSALIASALAWVVLNSVEGGL